MPNADCSDEEDCGGGRPEDCRFVSDEHQSPSIAVDGIAVPTEFEQTNQINQPEQPNALPAAKLTKPVRQNRYQIDETVEASDVLPRRLSRAQSD